MTHTTMEILFFAGSLFVLGGLVIPDILEDYKKWRRKKLKHRRRA